MPELPLEGIRVIGIENNWAGPHCTQLLGDLGAEVVKVESRYHWERVSRGALARPSKLLLDNMPAWQGGYPNGEPGQRPWNRPPAYNRCLASKRSMTVDMTRPEGLEIFKRLVMITDVVVENNAYGVLEKLGITYEMLKEQRPDIIYCRMPGFGKSGPYAQRRALGTHIAAQTGDTLLRWYPEVDLMMSQMRFHSDTTGALSAVFSVMAALHHRRKTGEGQLIEIGQAENVLPGYIQAIMDYTLNGREIAPTGNRDYYGHAPCGVYRCKGEDRWVAIHVTSEAQWKGLCRAMGGPAWTGEERFSDGLCRFRNQDDLDPLIEEWTTVHDHYALTYLLQKEGVPAGPVMDARDCYNDPHLKERDFFEPLTQEDCGTHLYPTVPWKFTKTPLHLRLPPCRFGGDNEYVYKTLLGVNDEEYARLEEAGHIGMDFVPEIP